MKVKVAETAGFCFGVKRAVDKVYQLIEEGTHPIYTLGPIIHNEEVVTDLAAKGVQVIEEKDLASLTEGTVVIRSHGVGKAIYQELKENHLNYVDVTCPFVLKIHRIVEKQSHAGKHVVIFGDPDHPEVKGICGWCQGSYTVLKGRKDTEQFTPPNGKDICVVSQTTFHYHKFKELVEILEKKGYIKRRASQKDKRNVMVFLTDNGKEYIENVRKSVFNEMKTALMNMGEDADEFVSLIKRAAEIINKSESELIDKNEHE